LDSTDRFLGGRLAIAQSAGYRAGADPVFLAAAVKAKPGERVLELGCGAGVALLCLAARVPGLDLTGLEREEEAAELARANAARNGIAAEIVTGDLAAPPAEIRAARFDHVMMNPPFFRGGTRSPDEARAGARHEETPLATWLDAGMKRLAPGGSLTVIQRAERLPDLLAGVADRLGGLCLRPMAPRAGRAAKLLLLSGRKGGRAPLRLLPPFVLHAGDSHLADGDDYAPEARAILRDGAAFPD